MRYLSSLAGLLVALSVAGPARAQLDPRDELSAPGGTRTDGAPEVALDRVEADEGALDETAIPEPPGSPIATDEPRYPVPNASQTAARAIEDASIRIPSRVTTRIRALDADLRALNGLGSANVVNAVLALLTGGLSITLGVLRERNTDELSVYLYVYGGVAAARGVLGLVMTPNASGPSIAYQHMPMSSPDEVAERLAYGEAALSALADQSLILRVVDAGLNLAVGAAIIPVLAAREFSFTDPLDYFVLIGAGVSLVSGIVTLIGASPAEQRWSAYQQLRQRLAEEHDEDDGDDEDGYAAEATSIQTRFALAPSPYGGFMSFGLQF